MFLLGHIGIGRKLVQPLTRGLPAGWVVLGTILPDLLDKPLYYSLSALTGKNGVELGMVSGTRTFGHTALLLISMALVALARRSRILAGVTLGMATHLVLDHLAPSYSILSGPSQLEGLLWPFLGWHFPVYPFHGVVDHISSVTSSYVWGGEVVGAAFLAWDYWKLQNQAKIRIRAGQHSRRRPGRSGGEIKGRRR